MMALTSKWLGASINGVSDSDIDVLSRSDFARIVVHQCLGTSEAEDIVEYLKREAKGLTPATELFDPDFIRRYYPLSLAPGEGPLAFVCRNWGRPWCYLKADAVAADATTIGQSALFDADFVARRAFPLGSHLDVAIYYCTEGYRLLIDPSERFSTIAYMIQNPDIAESRVCGLLHYERHGQGEGRPSLSTQDVVDRACLFSLAGAVQPAPLPGADFLVNCNQGGLMNRLIPALSLIDQAEKTGRIPTIWWTPNQHCAANFDDIFDVAQSGTPAQPASIFSGKTVGVWVNRIENGGTAPVPADSVGQVGLINSVTPWAFEGFATPDYRRLADIFRRMTLSEAVRRKLARFDHIDFSNKIGLHVRRAYPSGAFAALEQSKFGLDLQVYVNFVEWLKQQYPDLDGICLCTNSADAEHTMREAFEEVITFEKESFDNTSEAVAVQDALVDLILMSRCRFVISQSTTSFGFFASVIGRGNLLSIIGENANGHVEFITSHFGERIADIALDDTAAARLRAALPEA